MIRALLDLSREVIESLLEMQIRPPVRDCSCHISPPCNDCVEYGGLREAMKDAQSTVDSITAALAEPEPLNVWREAVVAQCSAAYIWLYEDDPKKTIENLIERHCELVTKPNGSNL